MRSWHVAAIGIRDYSDQGFWDLLVQRDPRDALREVDEIIEHIDLGAIGACLAHSARSRCLFELGRVDEALSAASEAVGGAEGLEPAVRAAVVMSSTVILAESGDVDRAVTALRDLEGDASGIHLARVKIQIAYVLHSAGRLNEAIRELDESERFMRSLDATEPRDRLRIHQNRGLVLLQQGRLVDAEADLSAAGDIAEAAGMAAAHAQNVANLAVLHGRARRLRRSLLEFDRAAALFAAAGNPVRTVAYTQIDRAEVLMHSGLPAEAVVAARSALELIAPSGNQVMVGDALLLLARAELAAGRTRNATASAQRAADLFGRTRRPDMRVHAVAVEVTARLRGLGPDADAADCLGEARSVEAELRAGGWEARAHELSLDCVRVAWRTRCVDDVHDAIERLRGGLADGRRDTLLPGHFAEAVARSHAGDAAGGIVACRAGLDVLDDIVIEADTLEQRSAAMQLGHDLSQLAIELAVDEHDAEVVLAAAEGTRARALHEELAPDERHRPLTETGADRLRGELAGRVGARTLVEWVVVRDEVWAVVVMAGRSRLVSVAARRDVVIARDRLLAWLDRANVDVDGSSRGARRAAAVLDELLLDPLELAPDGDVVIAPVDLLHSIPWSGLPTLAGRAVSLVPSAQLWLRAEARSRRPVRTSALLLGPDVDGAEQEEAAIRAMAPNVRIMNGDGATAAALRSILASSDIVHLAAHGSFRSDRPLLSTLRLLDGEVPLVDALPDRVTPALVVLSSCEGGAQGTADGSEVLGISAVLLARGATSVVAPLSAVRELECTEFVVEMYRELSRGLSVASSLAAVRARWLADDDLSRWAVASSFTCFGSGSVTVAAPT